MKRWKSMLVIAWVAFTSALAFWWYLFSVRLVQQSIAVTQTPIDAARQLSMLRWEGGTLMVSILLGGIFIALALWRQERERERLERFLSTFTHELRTPLASIQLQAETIAEQATETPLRDVSARLVSATGRLTLQLENSLLLASLERYQAVLEPVPLRELIETAALDLPELTIGIEGDATVRADRRSLIAIIRNILSNSLTHGGASTVHCSIRRTVNKRIECDLQDNGTGPRGDIAQFGKLFSRPYSGSGNGIGLYISRKLAELTEASIDFLPSPNGFGVRLSLPEGL